MDLFKNNGYGTDKEKGDENSFSSAENVKNEKNEQAAAVDIPAAESEKNSLNAGSADPAANNADSRSEHTEEAAPQNSGANESAEQSPNVTYHYTGGAERPFDKTAQTPVNGMNANTPYYTNNAYPNNGGEMNNTNTFGTAQNKPYNAPNQGTHGGYGQANNFGSANGFGPSNNFGPNAGAGGGRVYPPHIPVDNPKNNGKKKSGMSYGVIAIICAAGILLSGGAGFIGSWAAMSINNKDASSGGGSAVIYKSPETDSSNAGTDGTQNELTGSFEKVAAAVGDSVVEITTEFKVQSSMFQYVSEGAGSGVIISQDGYIVTNNHVITYSSSTNNGGNVSTGQVADTITIRLRNGEEYTAELVGRDADSDIAVLKIEAEGLTSAVVGNSDSLNVGTDVVAVGNPLGELGGTVTNGIISALEREIDVEGSKMNLLQTNAAVNPGNSGGGLFNMNGELIGIVNAKSSGSDVEGLGFAIPINNAMEIVEQLLDYGYVRGKVYLGVSFYSVSDAYTAYYYFKSNSPGIYVRSTEEGYNDTALKYGDRIVAVDGAEITSISDIKSAISKHSVGDTITFTVYRDNKLTEVAVTCYESVPSGSGEVSFETN